MKKIYILLALAYPFLSFAQQTSYSINFPSDFPADPKADIVNLLNRATSKQWEVSDKKDPLKGIVLKYKDNPGFKTKESFRVESNGIDLLTISSSSTAGLIFGMYKHLRTLGYKFYLPDELYTITPSVKKPFGPKKDIVDQPFLQVREFFGTGGFGSGRTDPDNSVEKSWNIWSLRNGFGSAYSLAGHRGENFVLENETKLASHSEWLASPLKKDGSLNTEVKLNYLNKEAVDFYTDWTIGSFKNNFKIPAPNITEFVSIEPSDGGGYPNDFGPSNKKLPSISDQVFGAANLAAAKLDRLFPDRPNIGVNLYAYSSHAEPPTFALNPRVFVQIIPYQFQNVAFGPAFIKRWASKAKRFGLYDYYKYPDSYWDLPGGLTIEELMKRAIHAAKSGSEGTSYESSYSKFSTGVPLWILGQYMGSGNPDWEPNYDHLIIDLYGAAAPAIKKLFGLFYRQPNFNLAQLRTATNYIRQAINEAKDERIIQRINELKLYLVYIYMYFESQDEKNGNLEQRSLPLTKIALTLYEKKIIHSYRIMQLVSYGFLNAKTSDASLASRYHRLHILTFPETDDPDAYWKKNYTYSMPELSKMFDDIGLNQNLTEPASVSSISDQIKVSKLSYKSKNKITIRGNAYVRGYFSLFAEKPTTITLNWSLTNDQGKVPSATISGTDLSYQAVYDYPLSGNSGNISVSLPAGKSDFFINASTGSTYTLEMQLNGAYCFFGSSPRGKMQFLDENGTHSYDPKIYPSYFYMPENVTEVQYRVQSDALKIIAPSGVTVKTKLIRTGSDTFEIRSFVPSSDQKGKFWKAVINNNYNYEMLNIPDVYFLFQEKN
jgi:hypothetical protein